MLCDKCKKNEANVFIIADINGKKNKLRLCSNCAKSSNLIDIPLSLMAIGDGEVNGDIVGELLGLKIPQSSGKKNKKQHTHYVIDDIEKIFGFSPTPEFVINSDRELKNPLPSECPLCKTKFSEIISKMRFGCANCYQTYGRYILKKSSDVESPLSEDTALIPQKSKIEKLKIRLANAIKKENYERAAIIRDEIKKLSDGLKEDDPQ